MFCCQNSHTFFRYWNSPNYPLMSENINNRPWRINNPNSVVDIRAKATFDLVESEKKTHHRHLRILADNVECMPVNLTGFLANFSFIRRIQIIIGILFISCENKLSQTCSIRINMSFVNTDLSAQLCLFISTLDEHSLSSGWRRQYLFLHVLFIAQESNQRCHFEISLFFFFLTTSRL